MTSGHMARRIPTSKNTFPSVSRSATSTATTSSTASTAYWIPRETLAFLRGLIPMRQSPLAQPARTAVDDPAGSARQLGAGEVLLEQLRVGAVLLGGGEHVVHRLQQLVVLVLGDREAVGLTRVELDRD